MLKDKNRRVWNCSVAALYPLNVQLQVYHAVVQRWGGACSYFFNTKEKKNSETYQLKMAVYAFGALKWNISF